MIVSRLDLTAFGRFTDLSLDLSAGPRRFHLIYGPNESGKSTSLRAITSLLFGMPHAAEDNFLHANASMRVGGLLVDEKSGESLECVRRRGRKATLRDGDDNDPVDESQLAEMLGGINRETFLTRFGLSHDELVAGGAAILSGEGDLGQILFAAGAGVGRLREIQEELDEAGSRLFTPRSSKTAINSAIRELDEKRKELRQVQLPPAEFVELRHKLEEKRSLCEQMSEKISRQVVELGRLCAHQKALPLLPRWRATSEALKNAKAVPNLDQDFADRRRQADLEREVARNRQTELESRVGELTARAEALPLDTAVMNHEPEIQALFQEVAARSKADRDRLGLLRAQKNVDRKIIDLLRQLSVEICSDDPERRLDEIEEAVERLQISDPVRTRIHELASAHERLQGKSEDASEAAATTKRRLADVIQELESCEAVTDPAVLTQAIEAMGDPQSILDAVAQQQESCDGLRRRCDGLLRRLEGFSGTVEEAAKLVPPSETVIQHLADDLRAADQEVRLAEEHEKQLHHDREESLHQIREKQQKLALPTHQELVQARAARDLAIDRLVDVARAEQVTGESIEQVRQAVRSADQLVDTIRLHSEQVHQRESLTARVADLDSQLLQARQAVTEANETFKRSQEAWLATWRKCGVKAGQPEQMQRWISTHEQFCEFVRQMHDEAQRLEQTEQRVVRAAKRLQGVLTSHRRAADDSCKDDLIRLYDEAVTLRSQRMELHQHRENLRRRHDELAEELPQFETRSENAKVAVERWRDDWQRTTEAFAKSEQVGTGEVLQMLDQIGDLMSKKRERDILETRIHSIGEDEVAYSDRVERLVVAVRQSVEEGQSPTSVAQAMYQRLQTERTASRSRETIREQIESTQQRLSEVAIQRSACETALKQLCHEAGCEQVEQLPEIERAAAEQREWRSNLQDLENQLSILAAGQSLSEFIQAASDQQPDLLEFEIDQLDSELKRLREEITVLQQETGAFQHELNRMDGSGRASELSQSIQLTAGNVSRDVEEYARIKLASFLLRQAIDHYRKENQSPVLAYANRFFTQLTCGDYSELKPDFDAKGRTTLFGINAAGKAVPVEAMSSGTADSLYLAMRFASLEHQLTHGKPVPLIIDDCLVQLDNARATAALRSLSELSERTQVILFTHHGHLRRLAEQHLSTGEYHVHELPS